MKYGGLRGRSWTQPAHRRQDMVSSDAQFAPISGAFDQHVGTRLSRMWDLARANPLGAIGAALIVLFIVAGLFAPLIAPYNVSDYSGTPNTGPTPTHPF